MINNLWRRQFTTLIGHSRGGLDVSFRGRWEIGASDAFWKELLWEIPVAVGMALSLVMLQQLMGLDPASQATRGFVATLAYLGPRGSGDHCWRPGWARRNTPL